MDAIFTYDTPHLLQWHWPIAVDLFLGGIGAGAFVVAVLVSLYYRDKFPEVSKAGAVLAPLCVIVGDLFLLAELGHPGRIYRTVIGFNVSSPFSWGGPLQGLMITVSLVYAYLWVKPRPSPSKVRNVVGIIGIPFAVLMGTYHGWLLTMVKARPLWNTGPATLAALMAFATTGIAAVLLVLCLRGKRTFESNGKAEHAGWLVYDFRLGKRRPANHSNNAVPHAVWMVHDLRKILVVGLVLQCVTLFVWWISLYFGSEVGRAALTTANAAIGPLFWIVGIALGLMLPAILQLAEIIRHRGETVRLSLPLTIATAALVLVGGFVFRYAVLIGGQLS